jgi:hypothetical protein
MQRKLESYFKITSEYNTKIKKCFIYDPANYRAFYCIMPEPGDQYITQKASTKLYYRPTLEPQINIPKISCTYSIPLVKSNLQKAIRRGDTVIAIQSAIALIQSSPMELLRRLPIIYIEDVCLMDSYSIVVWLMMADKDYGPLKPRDIDILLHIVKSLCTCMTYFPYKKNDYNYAFTHESLLSERDEILSIYYRSLYGGMHGDMQMLKTSIDYYRTHPGEIMKTEYNTIDYSQIEPEIDILMEAIDFHPYPQMLHMLQQRTRLPKDTIKEYIWFVESGYNIRKPEIHTEYKFSPIWTKIEKLLEEVRYELIS